MTLTEGQLTEIRQRADAAAPGPWLARDANLDYDPRPFWVTSAQDDPEGSTAEIHVGGREDAEFVAAARTDMSALLDEVVRLHEAVAKTLQTLRDLESVHNRLSLFQAALAYLGAAELLRANLIGDTDAE